MDDVVPPPHDAADALTISPTRLGYLTGRAEPFPVVLHPADGPVGVVLCPPFGWEEMSSYRPRRGWAVALATAGVPTVRLDYPGQGDAGGGPEDPARVAAWVDAIGVAAGWLRAETGCRRVVAVGISLGGLLALHATADGAAVDDFVLWGVPASGRAFTREVRVFGRLEAGRLKPDDRAMDDEALPEGALAAGGYLLSKQTRAALDALSVPRLPAARGRAALLLGRDGIAPPAEIVQELRDQGVAVKLAPGRGFGRMLTEPQFARLPEDVIAMTLRWIQAREADDVADGATNCVPAVEREVAITGPDGAQLRERVVEYAGPNGSIVGVLTQPASAIGGTVAVLLGGTGHRIGPNRMWVEISRRWAARGIPTLRVDVVGAGESTSPAPVDVVALYATEPLREIVWLVDQVLEETGAERVLCVGLCAGAYWALHTALAGRPQVVPLMVNLPTLLWDRSSHAERAVGHYRDVLFERETWRRLRRGDVSFANVVGALSLTLRDAMRKLAGRARAAEPSGARTPAGVLDALRDQGIGAWMFFAGREGLQEQLERDGATAEGSPWPKLHVDVVPGTSDLHTLRPLWLQHRFHERIDAALEAQLTAHG